MARAACYAGSGGTGRPEPAEARQQVGTNNPGVAPEAVGSLVACDFRVDGAAITDELLLAMREPPAAQGKAQCMTRGIGQGDSQRKWHRDPGDRLERADHVRDVLSSKG